MYYLGIMQLIVRAFAMVMSRVMGASGAESLNVAASIFMGQTEAPLTIRPFLPRMTRSELMTVMTSGMAHISGSIMVAYIAFGIEARHLLTAVIMTAPGTIMMAKLFEPETEVPETYGNVKLDMPKQDVNLLDAAARGTSEGLHLMLNVIAMLVSFVALVALLNGGFGGDPPLLPSGSPPTCRPCSAGSSGRSLGVMGVPWQDSGTIGSLLGTRMVLNEFIAFAQLGPMKEHARSALLHHRVVRAGGLRQLQLGRHPARRHRRAGAGAEARPRPARLPRHARRHAGQLPLGHDRGDSAVTRQPASEAAATRGRSRRRRTAVASGWATVARRSPSCWARASGILAERLDGCACGFPTRDIPHFPRRR